MYAKKDDSTQLGPSKYNSEWDKFRLLIWKNTRLLWSKWQHFILSVISPILFCSILISLRISGPIIKQPIENYPILNLSKYWNELLEIIDERKVNMSKRIEDFAHNPFIPQKLVGYAPNTIAFSHIMEGARHHLQSINLRGYDTCDHLRTAIIEENLLAGVCFNDTQHSRKDYEQDIYKLIGGLYPNHLIYRLIFPYACRIYHDTFIGINWYTHSLYHFINRTDQRNIGYNDGGYVGYIREGFAPLQNAISLSYLQLVAALERPSIQIPAIYMRRYPSKEFLKDEVIESIYFTLSLMVLFGNFYPMVMFIARIVVEKENKLKVYTKIMGINNFIHYLSWLVDAFQPSFISSVVVLILLKIKWSEGVAIFEKSGFFAILIVLTIYNVTSICFILMMVAFYKDSISAVTGIAIVWFLTYIPYILALTNVHMIAWKINVFLLVFHNTVLGFTLENILEFELFGRGFNLENFFDTRPLDDTSSIGFYCAIMLGQCIVYTGIGLYADELMPGNFGLAKPWNFLFTFKRRSSLKLKRSSSKRSTVFSLGSDASGAVVGHHTPFIYEVAGDGNIVLVDIQDVSKSYEQELVLQNITLQLLENEITILLGHNGAGKSTLLGMISGLIPITTGNITIDGFDVLKDQRYACASLGLSMADTVLYPDLTVEDQLRFFSYLKGFETAAVERELERFLRATKLNDYRLVCTRNLPMGIRQQLAICCALTGQSRVVLLDDPTTHMDLPARTLIWQLLEREKCKRTILISSTSANILEGVGDRVAIISNGELQCDGTPIFIKKMFGRGYRLIITKGPECHIPKVTARIRLYIPNIEPLCTLGNELIYALDDSHSAVFDILTADLEQNMTGLSIETVALRSILIDDIFFKLGSATPSYENRNRLREIMNGQCAYPEENQHLLFMEITKRQTGFPRILQQIKALWLQRLMYARHYLGHYMRCVLYPAVFVVLAFFVSVFGLSHKKMPAIDISLDQYSSSVTVIDRRPPTNGGGADIDDILDRYKELIFWLGIQHKLEETEGQLFGDYYIEKDVETLERLDQDHHVGVTFDEHYIVAWFNNVALHSVPLSLNLVHNAILRAIYGDQSSIEITMEPLNNMENHLDGLLRVPINTSNVLAVCVSVCMCCLWNTIVFNLVRDQQSGYANAQLLAGSKIWIYWLINMAYDSLIIIAMALLTTLTIFLCQYQTNVASHIYDWYVVVLTLAGWYIYSLNYMASRFFSNPVHAYALSLSFEAFGILCFCHVIETFEKGYVNTAKSPYAIYFCFLPLFAISSALSTVYYNGEFLRVCSDEQIRMTSIYLENCKATPNCCRQYQIWSFENGILMEVMALSLNLMLCWSLMLVSNYWYVLQCQDVPTDDYFAQLNDHKRRHDDKEESRFGQESSFMEHFKVQRLSPAEWEETPLVCDRLGKNYGHATLVDRLSLILNKYDCFGILGVSGCGISTLFQMLTGFEKMSYGRIFHKGQAISYNFSQVQRLMGHGQQHMINFPELTINSVLELFGHLHTYPPSDVSSICLNLAKVFDLFPHYDKHLNILSAGILNRLNCALAVMGNPQILLLDMATSGIDSAGKRMIWNVLRRMQHNGTAILSATISLRDCERFCSRVGFMSHGRLCLIGKPWHLDRLYADSHLLKVKFSRNLVENRKSMTSNYLYAASLNKLMDFVHSQFPNAVLKEHHDNKFLFLIPVHSTTISNVFTTMMRNENSLNIEDFELTRCSLSQSFIEFWEREYHLKSVGDPLSLEYPEHQ